MRILCSAGKGELGAEQCLACALAQQNSCGYDYTLLKAMFGTSESEQRSTEIHVTDLTGCLRKSWYSKNEPEAEYVHEMLTRFLGTAIHASLEDSDALVDCELPLSFAGLVGKADIVYKDGRIVDLKSSRWIIPSKVPYGSHSFQVNLYAYMLRRQGREVKQLQIQYVDASGPTKCRACRVPVRMVDGELRCPKCMKYIANAHLGAVLVEIPIADDRDIERFIRERKEALLAAMEMGLPPEMEPGYLCSYCPAYAVRCFPEG